MKHPSLLTLSAVFGIIASSAMAEQVVISEMMYNPPVGKPEFVELSNITATPLDMALWRFSDGVDFTFPNFSTGSPSAHLLLPFEKILISSATSAATRTAYPAIPAGVRIFGPWNVASVLDNGGEKVTLKDKNDVVVCTVTYSDGGKWAVSPDGAGHSLVLMDEDLAIDDWRIWRASTNRFGSPGVVDPTPTAGLAINEVHFSTVTGRVDWVELRNNSPTTTISAATMILSAATDLSSPVALSGSVTPGAVVSFNVDFATDNDGDVRIHLADSSSNVRDAVKLTRVTGRPSQQVFPAAGRQWYTDTADTRNAQNNPSRNTDIVINEIMAHPPSGQRDGEFIELRNKGASAVNVGGWRLDDDVDFTIPANTTIAAGGYLVLAANAAVLNANYGGLTALGNWDGSLSNSGSRVQLKDAFGNLVDEVDYRFGGEWPELADGEGSSLELVSPDADNSIGSSWRDSDESAKSTFSAFTINGGTYLRRGYSSQNDDEILMWLVGTGHVVIRNAQLIPTGGSGNLFSNANMTTLEPENISGWRSRGNHWATYHDAEGVHIIADGGGDCKVNHTEKDATGMSASVPYTLTFEARWVYGKPRIVTQTWDLSWGGTALVPIPQNLGTPGAQNSRFLSTPPPQVTMLNHSPATPPTSSTVTVTAKVSSTSPISTVQLFHRLDSADYTGVFTATTMTDNGTGGDVWAGDGIFTGQVPLTSFSGYNNTGAIVEFYVRATAANGRTTDLPRGAITGEPFPTAHPKRGQWVLDNQAPTTELRRLRVVIPSYWLAALNTPDTTATPSGSGIPSVGGGSATYNYKFPKLNSYYFPCTVVINESKVLYGSSVHKTGSPFTRSPGNSLDRGKVRLPGDFPYRGHKRIYWDNEAAGGAIYNNRVNRYLLYLCGVPANENEVLRVANNNSTYTIRESSEAFDKDFLGRIWENGSAGFFYELDDAFVIGDDGNARLTNIENGWDYNPPFRPGAENPVSYHNNFVPGSREAEYDFAALIEWCKQLEANPSPTDAQIERMSDTRAMAAYAAVRGYTADQDNFTMSRAKNGYFYNRASDHKWMLVHWDSDTSFTSGRINDPFIGSKTNVPAYYNRPLVRRELHFYMSKLMGEFAMDGPRLAAWLAAEEAVSPSFSIPAFYAAWPTTLSSTSQTRVNVMQNYIGAPLSATFALISPLTTTTGTTITINGSAPVGAFRVECVGQTASTFAWTATSTTDTDRWSISNIRLKNGANTLTFRAFDEVGTQIGTDIIHGVTKTNNAPPAMNATVSPGSQNAALGETVVVDASSSFDPDGTALTFTWTITPSVGFSVIASTTSSRTIQFTTPGNYVFTIQGSDGSTTQNVTREIVAYSTSDFASFGSDYLDAAFTANNVELLDNYSPDSWYSLNETTGSIALNLTDTTTRPLTNSSPIFPRITRALPASSNWILQTSIQPENRAFGAFFSGLYLETTESVVTTRYALCYDGGLNWIVYRASGTGAYSQIGSSVTYLPPDATLRIRRSTNTLFFEYRLNGVQWATITSYAMPAGSTAIRGGIFSATGAVNATPSVPGVGFRAAFDYLLLSNPGNIADLYNNLRITEIMYNPAGTGGVEFMELRNIGASAINLNGAYFDQGDPFSNAAGDGPFIFGATVLQPGQYCVVTNNIAGFTTLYGNGATIAGQYSGSLNNDGELIALRDPNGNLVHEFSYSNLAPWPVTADGGGPSIEVLSTSQALYGVGTNWRASQETGGSPGYLGFASDTDSDGVPDSVELAFGSNPAVATSKPAAPVPTRNAGTGAVTITWNSLNGKSYTIEHRTSLSSGTWETMGTVVAAGSTASYTDSTASATTQRFYRIKAFFP